MCRALSLLGMPYSPSFSFFYTCDSKAHQTLNYTFMLFEVTHQDKLIMGRHITIKFSLHFNPLIYIIIWYPIEDWTFYNNPLSKLFKYNLHIYLILLRSQVRRNFWEVKFLFPFQTVVLLKEKKEKKVTQLYKSWVVLLCFLGIHNNFCYLPPIPPQKIRKAKQNPN